MENRIKAEEAMYNINELFVQLQQTGPDFLKNYCIVNGAIWPLKQIEEMGLEEYAIRSLYSFPLKFYKYFPDINKEEEDENGNRRTVNYSISALESNEIFLSSPANFDDVFDSEINVPRTEFEIFRYTTYAQWSQSNVTKDMSLKEIADVLICRLRDIYSIKGNFIDAFDMSELGELAKGRITSFVLQLQLELKNNTQLDIAVKNAIALEYSEFTRQLQQVFRVACFTTTPVSQLMWGGSYANEHKGFCLEYTVKNDRVYEEIIHNIRPVVYCKVRRPVTRELLDSYDNNWNTASLWDIYFNGALRKSIDWAYQNEWRLLLPPKKYGDHGYLMKFFPITKVYLGNRMPAERRKQIIDVCKRKGIPYTGVIRSPNVFEMQECSILCDNCSQLNMQC